MNNPKKIKGNPNGLDSNAFVLLGYFQKEAIDYNKQLLNGQYRSLKELREAQNIDLRHTRKILNLRFLAGDIRQKILTDRVPAHWTMGALFEAVAMAHRHPPWRTLRPAVHAGKALR